MAIIRTACRLCLVGCGMNVEVEDGRVVQITGDQDHPISKGFLCIKGQSSIELMMAPERIIYPQKRVGERGSGQWQRVSWDEALDDIAVRLKEIIAKHGPWAVAMQSLPPKDNYSYHFFCNVIGSPTFFEPVAHQCFTPQVISEVLTFGGLLTLPDFVDLDTADVIMLWGLNLAETHGAKHARIRDAARRGVRTIVVDPRPIRSARQADLWLRIRPGTDAALALGMINLMITNDWYDQKFVRDWTAGFEALAERAAAYTPERVSEITWIPVEDIHRAAEMFGTASAAALYTLIGATMGGNSISTLRLMGFLLALTGRIDQPGNNRFIMLPPLRKFDLNKNLAQQLSADRFPLLAGPEAISHPYPHPRQVIDAMLTGNPYPVKALWTDCNPAVSLEDTPLILEALKKLDLLVTSEIVESPTAHLADYILPIPTTLESNAIVYSHGVGCRNRAVEPRGEAREEADALLEVLRRMDYELPVYSHRELLDYRLEPLGVTFDQLREKNVILREDEPLRYLSGKLRLDGKPGFNTPSGKIEFSSTILASRGHDPLPDFHEPPYTRYQEVSAQYPFVTITGTRSTEYYSTLGIELPRLRKRRPWPVVEMAPAAAAKLELSENDWVFLESPSTRKRIMRRVALLDGLDSRVLNIEGLWYMPGMDVVEGVLATGGNVLTELRDDFDPIIGGSSARAILCRVTKAEGIQLPT